MPLIRWFKEGTRAHTVGYAAGWGNIDDPRRPQVLLGDPELFHHHVQRSPYSPSHFAFAICFEELVPPPDALAVFSRMVDAMVVGRRHGQLPLLAVQHWEKGPTGARDRTAIHGYVGSSDLYRGRRFHLAARQAAYRIELAQELINLATPYTSPKDPGKARVVSVTMQPRTGPRIEAAERIRSAINLIGADQLTPSTLLATLHACGADEVDVDEGPAGRLAASFSCRAADGDSMKARVMIRPGQRERLLNRSTLQKLLPNGYERTPLVFELLRNEFLTQAAIAMADFDKKHGADPRHFRQVMEWAYALTFPTQDKEPAKQPRITEVFDRIPHLPAPGTSLQQNPDAAFSIRPLLPPTIGS